MKIKSEKSLLPAALLLAALGLLAPKSSLALSGYRVSNTPVKVYTEQGNDWFLALTQRTDAGSVLTAEGVLPGKYKMEVSRSDTRDGQLLALDLRMLDDQGRKIHKDMDVDLYVYMNNDKYYIGTVKTDSDGWMKVSGLSLDTVYEMDLGDGSHIGPKAGELRIKTKAQIDNSDWFQTSYQRTDNGVLTVNDALPGKYKFKAVGDAKPQAFTLKARLLDDSGQVARSSQAKLYAYVKDVKTFVANIKTDAEGWITLPKVLTGMAYRIKD
jgi:5-hydroxyisourate hydrolase-like protein (transthyretin family)